MDWQGQKLTELLMQYMLFGSALLGFLLGYFFESYRLMMWFNLVGVVLTFIITVPDWWFFNRHPVQWLPPRSSESATTVKEMIKARASKKAGKAKK